MAQRLQGLCCSFQFQLSKLSLGKTAGRQESFHSSFVVESIESDLFQSRSCLGARLERVTHHIDSQFLFFS